MDAAFHVVDVFAERKYAGNPLAVVESGGSLAEEAMLAVAREMNYSETTFIEGEAADGGYDVRIFTTEGEIPFAGHPTLGTAAVLGKRFDAGDGVTLNLGVGRIPVEVRQEGGAETLWMTQQPPEFGPELDGARLARALGLDAAAIDEAWPVEVVSTGLPAVLIPLVDRPSLARIEIDRPAYDDLHEATGVANLLAFCADPREPDHDLAARMFAPGLGVPEDPATGSANGCLAGYLARHRYFDTPRVAASVEQGYEMDRPSILQLEADAENGEIAVRVGGRVAFAAEGRLL
ncbi:phenazine biosynthesis protein [Halobacteriales archaeon QS_4_69_34]|nr:MAG: phenazine biosynthesis protein [Halobacteriales archaeon QS_4_69_34]